MDQRKSIFYESPISVLAVGPFGFIQDLVLIWVKLHFVERLTSSSTFREMIMIQRRNKICSRQLTYNMQFVMHAKFGEEIMFLS